MQRAVEIASVILFGALGLSHLTQPQAWAEFFMRLRASGSPGALVDGMMNLALAATIVAFHNVWRGIPTVLTVVGWCLLIKSLLRLCAPRYALRMMARVSVERAWEFQLAGAGLVGLAGVVAYGVFATR